MRLLKFISLALALGLVACGSPSNPMPAELDIDLKMHPILKQFFRICPATIESIEQGQETAARLGWKSKNDENRDYASEISDAYSLERDMGNVDLHLTLVAIYSKNSALVSCQMFAPIYDSDHTINGAEIDEYFDFDGGYYAVDEGHIGHWTVGDYSNEVSIYGNFREDRIMLSMSRKVPKSDPIYNR